MRQRGVCGIWRVGYFFRAVLLLRSFAVSGAAAGRRTAACCAWWPFCMVPSLQTLAIRALAASIHAEEPESLGLMPYGGGEELIRQLTRDGRLRVETLQPLLKDWSSAAALCETLGETLVNAAPGCRGLAALAAQRLRFEHMNQKQAPKLHKDDLPYGTRLSSSIDYGTR
jgi:hypothetical protein